MGATQMRQTLEDGHSVSNTCHRWLSSCFRVGVVHAGNPIDSRDGGQLVPNVSRAVGQLEPRLECSLSNLPTECSGTKLSDRRGGVERCIRVRQGVRQA